jgi:dTDP-4-amino-4,6-dideoxygalactose transaminase
MINICSPIIPDFSKVSEYMSQGFQSGQLSNFGPTYKLFEKRLRDFLELPEDREIVIVASGHVALMAAYAALNSRIALTSSYTFPSTYQAAEIQDVQYFSFDIDKTTLTIDVDNIDAKIFGFIDTFVITTPLSSIPDLEKIQNFCIQNNKILIIDGAPAFGTPGIYSYGDAFCLSFHATKSFGIGEGGAIICNKEIAKRIKQYINFGFDEHKNIQMIGTNGKISEYSCGIGLSILDQMRDAINKRLENAKIYREKLQSLSINSSVENTVYQTFPIFCEDSEKAKAIRSALTQANIQHLQYYRPFDSSENAIDLYNRNICLPVHHNLDKQTIQDISDLILSV